MASHDRHLSGEERRKIAKWREGKLPVPEIAYQLSRAPSTIYRELKPITDWDADLPQHGGCDAVTAQDKHERRRAAYRKLVAHPQPRLLSRKHSRRVGLRNRLLDGHGLNSTAFASASPGRRPCPPRHASRSRLAAAPSSRHGDGWRRVGSALRVGSAIRSTMAKRNGREHERQAQKALPGQIAHGFDKSTSEVDLPAPRFHASPVPGLPDTRQGLRTQPDGPQKQTG